MSTSSARVRLGATAFAIAAVLFVLYPAVRPWRDEETVEGATAAMGSGAWVASHLFAMVGFILLPLGLLAVRTVVGGTRAEPLAAAAFVVSLVGAGLTLPYYGAEDFALHAVAQRAAEGQQLDLLDLVNAIRTGSVAITMFGIGLLLLGVGAVLTGVAVWRSGVLPRYSAIPFAIGFVLFLPQFYAPAAVRIGHGVLVGIGLAWLAIELWRSQARSQS